MDPYRKRNGHAGFKMKQVLIRRGQVFVEQVPAPLVGEGNILVEVAYSLISAGSEVEGVRRTGESLITRASKHPDQLKKLLRTFAEQGIKKTLTLIDTRINAASPIGYSCSGVVVQVGSSVEGIKPGEFVACAGAGKANHAEVVLVPKNLVVKVPEGCFLRDAASVALGAIAMQGVRRAGLGLGEFVAIVGLGLLGQLTFQLLRLSGCRVFGFDVNQRRVELAKSLGLEWGFVVSETDIQKTVFNLTSGKGVDATIITAAAPSDSSIINSAAGLTRKKGRIVVVGNVGLGLDRSLLYEKELDVLISTSYGPGRYDESYEEKGIDYPYAYVRWTEKRNMEEYLQLLAERKVDFGSLVRGIYPIEDAPRAYRDLREKPDDLPAVLLDFHIGESSKEEKFSTRHDLISKSEAKPGRVNVAVIGAGSFARRTHLPNLQKLSRLFSIRAIATATGANAIETARQYGAHYCTTDYREVLEDDDVDLVFICTRHDLHAAMAIEAARAGKAIFLEKPMALNRGELRELRNVLEETGVPFTVGFNRRFSPSAMRAKEMLQCRKSPLMIIYRVNAGYIPPDSWIHGKEGGGRIIGEACHMLDLFNYFTESQAESIDVSTISSSSENPSCRDNFVATLKYGDGSVCTLMYTALGTDEVSKEYIEIFFDGTVLIIDDFKELKIYGIKRKGWKGAQDKGHLRELEEFGRHLMGKGGSIIPLNEIVQATEASFVIDEGVSR